MKAIEFIEKFGVIGAKNVVEYRDNHAKDTHVFKFNKSCVDKGVISGGAYLYTKSYNDYSVSVGDLKQIVDAFELVSIHGGLICAKKYLKFLQSSVDIGLYHGLDDVNYETEIPLMKKAIELVEKCNASY